jgi:hypothetical protein
VSFLRDVRDTYTREHCLPEWFLMLSHVTFALLTIVVYVVITR